MMNPSDCNSSYHNIRPRKKLQEKNKKSSTKHFDSNNRKNVRKKIGSKAPVESEATSAMPRDKIAPLSGKPFFTTILSRSQVEPPYQLTVPSTFYSRLPSTCVPVVLSYGNREWEMRYYGDRSIRRLDGGWRQFVADNKLKIGEGCVFELADSKNVRFEVQILGGEVPELFASCGRSSEIPIMVE